ncbi:MAG: hypothetical protein IJI67_00295 [Clostridia bacterium]|nr:hypothetical protein [Clostridia bacterium]
MKKVISIIAVLACIFSLGACAKKQENVPQELKDIPNAYVGDVDVQKKIKIGDLNIVIKNKLFYVNDIEFSFKDFENTEKLSTNMGKEMLDVYVKGGTLQKCVVTSADNTTVTEYNIEGKSTSMTVVTYDEYGNQNYVAYYDGEGNLKNFYTATFEGTTMTEKREYSADLDLVAVIQYEYDKNGKLAKEIIYDSKLQLKEVKDVSEEK